MYQTSLTDTIVAVSTGQSVAAISVIRMSGAEAVDIADRVFKGAILRKAKSHTIHYGRIVDEEGHHLDDVVISVYRSPKSYTSEDIIEISCHGSPFIIREIMALLIRQGARPAEAGEFTMRAFLHGRMDLSQAEAVADLIASHSRAAHELAVAQLRGGVSSEIKILRQKLLDFVSLIELELDFGEEDVEFANRDTLKKLVEEIITLTSRLRETFHIGHAIKEGIPTVIAGRPNAGKSTLLNALLQEERAIVSDIPGTTRDTIEEILVIEGIQFRLVDTAGIREAHDEIEVMGIGRTMEKIGQASILVYVFDITSLTPVEVASDIAALQPEKAKVILAANKMDLNPYAMADQWKIGDYPIVPLSAANQMNIHYLKEVISASVIKDIPSDLPVISSARHYHALDRTEARLKDVLAGLGSGITHDFLAQDIRQALYHLSEITGEISTEDILGNIFGRFCIGK